MIALTPAKGYVACSSCGAESDVFEINIYRFIQQKLVYSLCLGCLNKLAVDIMLVQEDV